MEQACLYCGKKNNHPFCVGGGPTIYNSKTGEGKKQITKSYCYNDFLTIISKVFKFGHNPSNQEKEFIIISDQVKEWYKEIPFQTEKMPNDNKPIPKGIYMRGYTNAINI